MAAKNEPYRPQIDAVLHRINLIVEQDWSFESPDVFNRQVSVNELARLSAMSVRNLHIVFKAYTGEHLHQYINRLRLERAVGMLQSGYYTNERIAGYIGFANVTAFYNAFKKYFGVTPARAKRGTLAFGATPAVLMRSILPILLGKFMKNRFYFFLISEITNLPTPPLLRLQHGMLCMNMPIAIICCRKRKSIGEFVMMTPVSPSLINVVFMLV